MENIRLPEDFTDRVMHRIEARERAAARRTRAAAVAGGILGGVFLIAATIIILRRYGIDLSLLIGPVSDFLSRLSVLLHSAHPPHLHPRPPDPSDMDAAGRRLRGQRGSAARSRQHNRLQIDFGALPKFGNLQKI